MPLTRDEAIELLGPADDISPVADDTGLGSLVKERLGPDGGSYASMDFGIPARASASSTLILVFESAAPHPVRLVHIWDAFEE